ncbi:MAG: glycerol-3-phosphate 1-O-acyltransferase PlsY [Eubacteriaceae bacterium]|jgi:glycerol-3-phosphate acyltransferase PlsY
MNPWYGVLLVVVSYLIGNLDFAYIIVKATKGVDIRDYGSGNPGMSNVLRTQGGKLAAWVFIGDALKGFVCVWAARMLGFTEWWVVGAGMAVVSGHNWPVLLHFRGGKGVSTSLGAFMAFDWFCGIIGIIIGGCMIMITKYMSLGNMIGICVVPFVVLFVYHLGNPPELVFAVFLAVTSLWQHRGNIKRLINGTERKLGEK